MQETLDSGNEVAPLASCPSIVVQSEGTDQSSQPSLTSSSDVPLAPTVKEEEMHDSATHSETKVSAKVSNSQPKKRYYSSLDEAADRGVQYVSKRYCYQHIQT